MMFDPTKPFNDLPLLPPPVELETPAILKAVVRASRPLGELKGQCGKLPNPRILVQALVLQEAKGSSEIEGIVTTHDSLYRALGMANEADIDPGTKEVLRYREAVGQGVLSIRSGKPLCVSLYEDLVKTIKLTDGGIRKIPGTQLRNDQTGAIVYTPPEGEEILREKLSNFDRFLNNELAPDMDPLIKLAVAHYQFEAIHPFHDGNGRVGRLINVLYLMQCGLIEEPVLYLSGFIFQNRSDYYRLLQEVTTHGAWEPWVLYMIEAVHQTAIDTIKQVKAILACMKEFADSAKKQCPRAYSKDLVELLFERPYCRINLLAEKGLSTRQTASRYLTDLVETDLLRVVKYGKEKIYINHSFLNVLKKSQA